MDMDAHQPLRFFVYREGVHFDVPSRVAAAMDTPKFVPLYAGKDNDFNCPRGRYVSVASPEDADYIVFPYIIDDFIQIIRAMPVHYFIRELPFFRTYERKHVFFHCHDHGHPLFTQGLILTTAPDRSNADDPYVRTIPYRPGHHVLRSSPDYNFNAIDLDTNFMGTLSWPVRCSLIQGVFKEEGLRFHIQCPNTVDWACKKTSYLHMADADNARKLEEQFLDAMRRSWTTLCPRGLGSSSIRFFETMCLGRIPVHVSDSYRPPFDDEINYSEFCLFIPEAEANQAGLILRAWLAKRDRGQREIMCRKAREVWERYFKPEDEIDLYMKYLRRHLTEARITSEPRYGLAPSPLLGENEQRIVTPQGFYANMVVDERNLWLDSGLQVKPAVQPGEGELINSVRSYADLQSLLGALDLMPLLPENAVVACTGAPSGVLAIMLANGLVKARNFSSLLYCVEDWGMKEPGSGETRADFRKNIEAARVGDFVRPLQGKLAPEAFKGASVHMAVVAVQEQLAARETLGAWIDKLTADGIVAVIPPLGEVLVGSWRESARDLGLMVHLDHHEGLLVLRKVQEQSAPRPGPETVYPPDVPSPVSEVRSSCEKKRVRSGPGDERFLAVKASGGLGNRLLGIMCASVYSMMTGRKLCVDWSDFMYSDNGENVFPKLFKLDGLPFSYRIPRTEDICPEFWRELLYVNALLEQYGINHLDPRVMDVTRVDLTKRYEQTIAAFWSFNLDPLHKALEHVHERLPRFAGLDVDEVCGELMKKHILPRPVVTDRVDAFAEKNFSTPMVGVHIRQTDLRMPLEEVGKTVEDLKRELGARVYLATDNPRVERMMGELFKDELVLMPKRYPDGEKHMHSHRITGMSNFDKAVDAMVEMYLLSRCNAIVRYQPSSFARISGYCSNLPAGRLIAIPE